MVTALLEATNCCAYSIDSGNVHEFSSILELEKSFQYHGSQNAIKIACIRVSGCSR